MVPASDLPSRLLYGLALVAAGTLLFAGYVAFAPAGARGCDPIRPDEEQCPEGQWCLHERCQTRVPTPRARRGESCHDRTCASAEDACGPDLRCYPKSQLMAARAPTCESPAVRAATKRLRSACQERRQRLSAQAERGGCSAEEWNALLESDETLRDLLAAFQERHVVYFPAGEPRHRQRWSGEAAVAEQLAPFRDQLRAAKMVVVLGRASADGKPQADRDLALRRMDVVMRAISGALDLPLGQGPMLTGAGVRASNLSLDVFVANFAGPNPPIAASPAERARLREAFDAVRAGQPLTTPSLERMVSRHVLVIPIPCDLNAEEAR